MKVAARIAVLTVVPLALAGAFAAPASAGPKISKEKMSHGLKWHLAELWAEENFEDPEEVDLVVSERRLGRKGSTRYAFLCVWDGDSPAGSTDCGTVFRKKPGQGWRIIQEEVYADGCGVRVPAKLGDLWWGHHQDLTDPCEHDEE